VTVVVGKTTLESTPLHSHDGIVLRVKRGIFEQACSDCRFGQVVGAADERFVYKQEEKTFQSIEVSKRAAVNDSIELLSDRRRVQ
jgi:hypothetical protein